MAPYDKTMHYANKRCWEDHAAVTHTYRSRRQRSLYHTTSFARCYNNKESFQNQITNNQSTGWINELSSLVLSMGHKLISGAAENLCNSDESKSEVISKPLD